MEWAESLAFAAFGVSLVFPLLCFFLLPSLWVWFASSLIFDLSYAALCIPLVRYFAKGGQFTEPRPNLAGKTLVLTGATPPGIGFQACVEFARMGAQVIMGVRGTERAASVAAQVAREVGLSDDAVGKQVIGISLDLSSLKEVRHFADEVLKRTQRIDFLVNNAGVMFCPHELTVDGLELQMATNHFGHFYLTKLFLPTLLKCQARVLNVSSAAHVAFVRAGGIVYEKMADKATYDKYEAYGESKLANVYFTQELQRRFGSQGLRAYALHPGAVATNLMRHMGILGVIAGPFKMLTFKTPLEGAQTTLFCALSDKAEPGLFHSDCKVWHSPMLNAAAAEKWWDFSEEVIRQKTAAN